MIGEMNKAEIVTISKLCELFEVPLSSHYYKPIINSLDEKIIKIMQQIHQDNFQSYSQRRMVVALEKQCVSIGITKTTYYQGGKEKPSEPNLLKWQFDQTQSDTHWVGDITYIINHQGWSYLDTVLDLGIREIVVHALSKTPDAALAKQALMNAIALKQTNTKALLLHSDQGVQYDTSTFKQTLALHGITQSMSHRGNCWDNAVQERFCRNLKSEYLNRLSFINHRATVTTVDYYNKRINSATGYIAPAQKRQELLKVAYRPYSFS